MEMIGDDILRRNFFSSKDGEDNSLRLFFRETYAQKLAVYS
jgi:hypothetical protein